MYREGRTKNEKKRTHVVGEKNTQHDAYCEEKLYTHSSLPLSSPGSALTRTGILAYDYTVLAGTQGGHGHHKADRILETCERQRLPVVCFCEGGGGRPGDTEGPLGMGAGLAVTTFATFSRLSGLVPLVGVASGYCFAGNAAFLGVCDVIIATQGCNIGMGGPAMIEGGGLGVVAAKDIGPLPEQVRKRVISV
jgi:acetyl-CoA carboxylase carboxyltransferase component